MELMASTNRIMEVQAITLQDVISTITASTIILKMDIEGYECKVGGQLDPPRQALQPPVLLGEGGRVPLILLEWDKVARWGGGVIAHFRSQFF